MDLEILNLPHGYTAKVCRDDSPENPWEAWDCQPPIMVFNLGRGRQSIQDYGTGLSLRELFFLVPCSVFSEKWGKIMEILDLTLSDFSQDDIPTDAGDWKEILADCLPETPSSWGDAIAYFNKCEALCRLAGIPCLNEQSNGYCQGDSSRVFMAATPEWVERVGWNPEDPAEALQSDLKTWSAWAWGDVYGVSNIRRPGGKEIADGSCWGYYGSNHDESGLAEFCRASVGSDRAWLEREALESHRAACCDIVTVG